MFVGQINITNVNQCSRKVKITIVKSSFQRSIFPMKLKNQDYKFSDTIPKKLSTDRLHSAICLDPAFLPLNGEIPAK